MNDNFEFDLVGGEKEPFIGYISSKDKTALSPQAVIRGSQNTYKKLSGNWANRPGLKRRGAPDDTLAGVKSAYEWYNSLNDVIPLRVANNKLQFESDIAAPGTFVWYDLVLSSTLINPAATLTRLVFSTWWDNTEKKDRLVFVRGDSNMFSWSGGFTLIGSNTINTITKADATTTWAQDGFATNTAGEKKIIIDIAGTPTEFTYTGGENTQTLTGITPSIFSSIPANTIAVQPVIQETDKPAAGYSADFITTIGNRVHVGSYSSRLVYISDQSDFKNFTVPTPRTPGSAELLTLDNNTKGITVRNGNAHIAAGLSDWYEVIYIDQSVGSPGSEVLIQQTKVDKKPTSVLSAALAHEFIDTVGNDVVYLSQDQQLRVLGTFRNINQAKYPSLSQQVFDEFAEEDFTGGALRAIGDFIYITAPNSGRDYMHQTREYVDQSGNVYAERLWHAPQIRNISRFAVINGVIYGHSNANPQIYQVWDTAQWYDDSPSEERLPYLSRMVMAYRNHGRPQGLIAFDKVYYEGYATQGSEILSKVYIDYQGSTSLQSPPINTDSDPATFFVANSSISLGDSSLGDNPLGQGIQTEPIEQENLPKFRKITDITLANCFEYSLEVYSEKANSRWEMERLGSNAEISDQQATFIRSGRITNN